MITHQALNFSTLNATQTVNVSPFGNNLINIDNSLSQDVVHHQKMATIDGGSEIDEVQEVNCISDFDELYGENKPSTVKKHEDKFKVIPATYTGSFAPNATDNVENNYSSFKKRDIEELKLDTQQTFNFEKSKRSPVFKDYSKNDLFYTNVLKDT